MTKNTRTEETHTRNGVEHGTHAKSSTSYTTMHRSELMGYGSIVVGLILLAYTAGWLPFVNWVVALGAVALVVYGAREAHLVEKTHELVQRMRKK